MNRTFVDFGRHSYCDTCRKRHRVGACPERMLIREIETPPLPRHVPGMLAELERARAFLRDPEVLRMVKRANAESDRLHGTLLALPGDPSPRA